MWRGLFSVCMVVVWRRRVHIGNISHSWFKMTWHRHLSPPCYRPTGSITARVMSVARALAYIQCIQLGKAQPHPRAENSSCWDRCCTDKSQQGRFYFFYPQCQASVRLLWFPASSINERFQSPSTCFLTQALTWMRVMMLRETSADEKLVLIFHLSGVWCCWWRGTVTHPSVLPPSSIPS